MDDWIHLIGIFISDGYCDTNTKCIYINPVKDINIKMNTLNKLSISYSIGYLFDGQIYISGDTYPDIYQFLLNISSPSQLPDFVWNLSNRQCRLLLEFLMKGDRKLIQYEEDDYEDKANSFYRFKTSSIRLANDISRLALHSGYSAIIENNDEYQIYITTQNQPAINKNINDGDYGGDDSDSEKLVHYTGKVYCIEAPSSHVYYMRESIYSPSLIIGNSSRHGQKGTVGNIIPEMDMPFTKDGLRPDVIINPHAIPSRMTIAQLKETLLGKVLLELGMFGDGTSFGNLDVKTIAKELQRIGYESYGNEVMYNGLTGEQMETSIFIGPVFYQRLKHMVNDKQHSRSIGPMVNLTRQPAEGRSRDGGFRIGEMERDVMIAHGASRFCRERLYDASDKYSIYVCKKCGLTVSYNDGDSKKMYTYADFSIHLCKTCGNKTDFAKIEVPYAFKLLSQELQTINVVPRIITE